MDKKLTPKQAKVFLHVKKYMEKKGMPPTLSELKDELGKAGMELKSNNSLVQYLDALEEKEYIQRFQKARGIRLLDEKIKNFFSVPLFGRADCGEALSYADDHVEDYINISKEFIKGKLDDYFFIKAVGDSMDKEGIEDKSLVLVKKIKRTPISGENVLAIINGLATIKKFKKMAGAMALLPCSRNKEHQPIILHPDDSICICGKIERVFPSFN